MLAAFMMRGPYASPAAFCAELKAEGPHRARTVCRVDPLRASRKLGALRENGMFVARVDAAETLYYAATKVDSGWYFAAHEAQLTSTTSDRKITLDGSWDSGFVQPDGDLVFHRATFASAEGRSPPTFLTVMLIVGTGESLEPACVGFSSGNTTSRKPLDLALTAPLDGHRERPARARRNEPGREGARYPRHLPARVPVVRTELATIAVSCPKEENDTAAPASTQVGGTLVGWATFDIGMVFAGGF